MLKARNGIPLMQLKSFDEHIHYSFLSHACMDEHVSNILTAF